MTRRTGSNYGLTPKEKAVMDLHDDGWKRGEIADILGFEPRLVAGIIYSYDVRSDINGGKFRRMIERGSRFLADAIELQHGSGKRVR